MSFRSTVASFTNLRDIHIYAGWEDDIIDRHGVVERKGPLECAFIKILLLSKPMLTWL